MPSSRPRDVPARGFVLVMTLWIIAGIAIAVALMTLWALDAVRDAGAERARTDAAIAMQGTRDVVLYLGATRPVTRAGLPVEPFADDEEALRMLDDFGAFDRTPRGGELRLDGRPYVGVGDTTFRLQDAAGLYPLNGAGPADLTTFLSLLDADADVEPARLLDALLDYIDADDLRRLNGAEAGEYERDDLSPPPNRRLLVPSEVFRVRGWDALSPEARVRLEALATTRYAGAINLNAVPAELLQVWLPGCDRACAHIVARRETDPFMFAREVELALGATLPGDPALMYRFTPSDTLHLTFAGPSGGAMAIHVRFTPLADQRGPWSILAAYPVPRPTEHVPPQPTGSDLFADTPPGR